MPELPEVERARKLIQDTCLGYKIKSIDSTEDKIVYTGGTDHLAFAKEIEGRTITGCERKGKTFWMTLSGEGRMPVMHFGMTGMVQLHGRDPTWYIRRPKEREKQWPPRYYKFVLELEPQPGSIGDEPRQLAFIDARRLARLRLIPAPVPDHPPVSLLGFDPVLCHPTFEEFQALISKKKGTVKGMIMDQAFSAGVGNWVADEVLYQARIHPACPVPALSPEQVKALHYQLRNICQTAVDVNANHKQFPEDWLFRWRWSKGRKQKNGTQKHVDATAARGESDEEGGEDLKPKNKSFLPLPNGKPATISFIEVGGRTTAFVEELQKMPEGVEIKPKISKGGKGSRSKKGKDDDSTSLNEQDGGSSSALSELSDEEPPAKPKAMTARQRAALDKVKKEPSPIKDVSTPVKKATKRKSAVKVEQEEVTAAMTPIKKTSFNLSWLLNPAQSTVQTLTFHRLLITRPQPAALTVPQVQMRSGFVRANLLARYALIAFRIGVLGVVRTQRFGRLSGRSDIRIGSSRLSGGLFAL